ncbi:MAG: bifunctional nuclease family protein [Balneolales bacterium]|nr:bifunctional nuclease family protein [Balneolales bacterium]
MEKIQVDILGLSTSPSSGGAYALILNEVNGTRRLPIIIGTYEAQAIALELEHIKPPRPMTHDLIKQVVEVFGASVHYVFINSLKDGTFFAQIVLESNNGKLEIDARPSDAIAVAVRFAAPIYVSDEVIKEAGVESEPAGDTPSKASKSVNTGTQSDLKKPGHTIETRLELLEKNLSDAIAAEDYELAAKLRDEIKKVRGSSEA